MSLSIALQILLAAGIFNVWVLRRNRSTPFRPAGADNIREEFARYGLPEWAVGSVGAVKVGLAALLLVGVVIPAVALPSAAALTLMMSAAIVAHVRVGDPIVKSMPAAAMLLMSAAVVAAHAA